MRILSLLAGCTMLIPRIAAAQQHAADSVRGVWVAGALGAATTHTHFGDGDAEGAVGVNVQHDRLLASARWHSLGLGVGNDIESISALIGLASTTPSFGFAAISAGLNVLKARECTAGCGLFADTGRELGSSEMGAGVVIAGDAALRLGHKGGASLGLTGFLSLNTAHSFAGIGLEITAGRWR